MPSESKLPCNNFILMTNILWRLKYLWNDHNIVFHTFLLRAFSNVNNQRLVCSSKKKGSIVIVKIIFRDYHGWTKALKIKFHAYFLRNKDEIQNGMCCWMKWFFEFSNWFLGRFLYTKQCAPIKIFKQKSFLCIQKRYR